jgi:hypothetical protein
MMEKGNGEHCRIPDTDLREHTPSYNMYKILEIAEIWPRVIFLCFGSLGL